MRPRIPATALTVLVALTALLAPALPAGAAAPSDRMARVVGLRYAAHDDFDRVVFDISGALPRPVVLRTRTFTYEFSGDPVPIRGRAGLVVSLYPAQVYDDQGHGAYAGPRIARPHLETLRAVALIGDWEGQATFALALEHRADYRVLRLHDPERIVVDLFHAAG